MDESFDLAQRPREHKGEPKWQIQTLNISISWDFMCPDIEKPAEGEGLVRDSLLAICAHTLEVLIWISGFDTSFCSQTNLPAFTGLRGLQLDAFLFPDDSHLQAFIPKDQSCRLRSLAAFPDASPATTKFFMTRGCIDSLQDFVWRTYSNPECRRIDGGLSFLRANPQLLKFRIGPRADARLLNERVVPLLSHHFYHLTSLSPTWGSRTIDEASLQMIGRLTSLEQLHLSAGN